eukprot:5381475-Prymnesium_polylepis.1
MDEPKAAAAATLFGRDDALPRKVLSDIDDTLCEPPPLIGRANTLRRAAPRHTAPASHRTLALTPLPLRSPLPSP